MIRTLMLLVGILSFAILSALGIGLGWLYWQGRLTHENLWNIRVILEGRTVEEAPPEPAETAAAVSTEQVLQERARRSLELDTRENELKSLKSLADETAIRLIQDRKTFDERKEEFRKELAALQARIEAESTEQTRAILLASKPEDAVARLMGLTLEENVELLRGVPEKTTAKILQSFDLTPDKLKRGQEIFEALYRGVPQGALVDDTLQKLGPPDNGP